MLDFSSTRGLEENNNNKNLLSEMEMNFDLRTEEIIIFWAKQSYS